MFSVCNFMFFFFLALFRDCVALQVMMESRVYQVNLVSRVLQVLQHTQGYET